MSTEPQVESYATAINQRMERFEQWARERNFYAPNGATYTGQFLKLMEECGELAGGMARNSQERIKDAIGDVLCVLAVLRGFTPKEEWNSNWTLYDTLYDTYRHNKATAPSLNDAVAYLRRAQRDLLCCMHNLYALTLPYIVYSLGSIAMYYNLTLIECLDHVWDEIKNRQGIMYNGVFVKSTDPRYAELTGLTPERDVQDIGCSAVDVRSMQEDDIVDN